MCLRWRRRGRLRRRYDQRSEKKSEGELGHRFGSETTLFARAALRELTVVKRADRGARNRPMMRLAARFTREILIDHDEAQATIRLPTAARPSFAPPLLAGALARARKKAPACRVRGERVRRRPQEEEGALASNSPRFDAGGI